MIKENYISLFWQTIMYFYNTMTTKFDGIFSIDIWYKIGYSHIIIKSSSFF